MRSAARSKRRSTIAATSPLRSRTARKWKAISSTGKTARRWPIRDVRVFPKNFDSKLSIPYSEIQALAFTGRDTAAGKSWEAWLRKYWEKKTAGEHNIQREPEALE